MSCMRDVRLGLREDVRDLRPIDGVPTCLDVPGAPVLMLLKMRQEHGIVSTREDLVRRKLWVRSSRIWWITTGRHPGEPSVGSEPAPVEPQISQSQAELRALRSYPG